MLPTILALAAALVASNAAWWIHNRSLKGVISDLKNATTAHVQAKAVVAKVADSVKTAAK